MSGGEETLSCSCCLLRVCRERRDETMRALGCQSCPSDTPFVKLFVNSAGDATLATISHVIMKMGEGEMSRKTE